MIVFKEIKPARLKVDAMRLQGLNRMRKVSTEIKADFEKTTATWRHKPKFEVLISLVGGFTVFVDTNDKIYGYVSRGTEAHDIWAGYYTGKSDKKVLAFSSKFAPKTKPSVIASFPGSVGSTDTFRPYVRHPGTEPRNFDKEIQKKWQPKFKREMEELMRDMAKASGHGL